MYRIDGGKKPAKHTNKTKNTIRSNTGNGQLMMQEKNQDGLCLEAQRKFIPEELVDAIECCPAAKEDLSSRKKRTGQCPLAIGNDNKGPLQGTMEWQSQILVDEDDR